LLTLIIFPKLLDMSMKNLSRGAIVLVISTFTSWIGALFDHGDWFGVTSTIFGIVGIGLGIYIAYLVDDYVNM